MNTPLISEDAPFRALRKTWQPVALSRNVGVNQIRPYTLLGEDLIVVRFPDRLLAAPAGCPHKGSKLEIGCVSGGELRCAYHGWRFNDRGRCTKIPSLPDPSPAKLEQASLVAFEVRERYGMIWVRLEPGGAAALPDVPEFENPEWTFRVADPMVFRAGFRREIENYLDMTHFAFAHSESLGVAADPVLPPFDITEHQDGFQMDGAFPRTAAPGAAPSLLQEAHRRRYRVYLPNFTTIRQTFPDGTARVLVHIPSPNTPEQCTVFWALAISPGFQGPSPEKQLEFAVRVLDEDRIMCENQIPREVPINPARGGWGVLVTPGDTLANTFQRQFREFLLK